ncbi:hypothetical protein SUGI_1509740 [Cryptomeria japonica]|uniref:Uncharacterized protein n=1 Tax=Cryptomeria japonica TaxID=3369 RepID=A0AAD3RS22_CRYJA|nr:hypothetical protein SUGI_1495520 [Cryptomeria japonica]GLJ59469.1 hypothetical protein SUGI_1509740 [Cryptomeria japonica]
MTPFARHGTGFPLSHCVIPVEAPVGQSQKGKLKTIGLNLRGYGFTNQWNRALLPTDRCFALCPLREGRSTSASKPGILAQSQQMRYHKSKLSRLHPSSQIHSTGLPFWGGRDTIGKKETLEAKDED